MATLGVALLDAAMPALGARADEVGWRRTTERDFQRAVDAATNAGSAAIRLSPWPGVGRLDLMLPGRVAVELKWSRGDDTLANCAWDAAKLATALAEGAIAEGYLAAGAPRDHWRTSKDGVELFGDRVVFAGDAIVRRYESWWRFWCKDVQTRPIELPTALAIECVAEALGELQGCPWSIRLGRVDVVDGTWRPHVCPHQWRGEACR